MSTWGEDIFENDCSADIEVYWKDFVVGGSENTDSLQSRADLFFNHIYFNYPLSNFTNIDLCNELLAVGKLYLINELKINDELKEYIEYAAGELLSESMLTEWENSDKRKKVIKDFLVELNGTPRLFAVDESLNETLEKELKYLKKLNSSIEKWATIVSDRRIDSDFEKIYDVCFNSFERFIARDVSVGLGQKINAESELQDLRAIAYCFYLTTRLDMPIKMTLDLCSAVEDNGLWLSID